MGKRDVLGIVVDAIHSLQEAKGSSAKDIRRFIDAYPISGMPARLGSVTLKRALRNGVDLNVLSYENGRYKLDNRVSVTDLTHFKSGEPVDGIRTARCGKKRRRRSRRKCGGRSRRKSRRSCRKRKRSCRKRKRSCRKRGRSRRKRGRSCRKRGRSRRKRGRSCRRRSRRKCGRSSRRKRRGRSCRRHSRRRRGGCRKRSRKHRRGSCKRRPKKCRSANGEEEDQSKRRRNSRVPSPEERLVGIDDGNCRTYHYKKNVDTPVGTQQVPGEQKQGNPSYDPSLPDRINFTMPSKSTSSQTNTKQ